VGEGQQVGGGAAALGSRPRSCQAVDEDLPPLIMPVSKPGPGSGGIARMPAASGGGKVMAKLYVIPKMQAGPDEERPLAEVIEEYCSWGRSQGARRGFGWSLTHARLKRSRLDWWADRLGLTVLGDLDGRTLSRAEKAIQGLQAGGASGKSLMNYIEAIKSFCSWCQERDILFENPVKGWAGSTPRPARLAAS
jgi:hypothetical protein